MTQVWITEPADHLITGAHGGTERVLVRAEQMGLWATRHDDTEWEHTFRRGGFILAAFSFTHLRNSAAPSVPNKGHLTGLLGAGERVSQNTCLTATGNNKWAQPLLRSLLEETGRHHWFKEMLTLWRRFSNTLPRLGNSPLPEEGSGFHV